MLIPIDKIRIAERIRKEIIEIDELAENIREHGLIAPIAIMEIYCRNQRNIRHVV